MTSSLREHVRTFMIISDWILLRMGNVSDKSCRENKKTFCAQYIFPWSRAVCEIMWKIW